MKQNFFIIDPYMTSDFQNGKGHLLRIWFELCGLTYKGEEPQFFLSKVEKQFYKTAYQHKKTNFSYSAKWRCIKSKYVL